MTPKILQNKRNPRFQDYRRKHNETVISGRYTYKKSPQLLTEEINAMSLKEALDDIAEKFASQNPNMKTLYYTSLSNIRKWRVFDQVRSVFTRELVTKIEENIATSTGKN